MFIDLGEHELCHVTSTIICPARYEVDHTREEVDYRGYRVVGTIPVLRLGQWSYKVNTNGFPRGTRDR